MAALTKDRATPYREGVEVEYPVAAGVKIYAGSLVCVNTGGFATPAADTSGFRMAGVALEQVDNTGGADGAEHVRVRRHGVFEFDAEHITQAMVCDPMYAVDDHTFAPMVHMGGPVRGREVRIGVLVKYGSPTKGWIDIAR